MFFQRSNSVEKQLLNSRNTSVSHCVRNSSLTIIWNNLGLSNDKHMKRKLGLKKNKNTCYNFKRNYVVPYSKESHLTVTHLWDLSTIPSFSVEYFAVYWLLYVYWKVFLTCLFFLNSKFLWINLIRQTQIIPNDTLRQILETEWHWNISEI